MGTIAIFGAGGVLGAKLVEQALHGTDDRIFAYAHRDIPRIPAATEATAAGERVVWRTVDISDGEAVDGAMARARPDTVIVAAAMTNVDACERDRDAALAANAKGPREIARACVVHGARLVHVSTDYVFPGDDEHSGPYTEEAEVHPVNYYGYSKLQGERAVMETCADLVPWCVVRTALVYGYVPGGRTNFIRWLAGELRDERRVKIVSDQVNTPTLADDLARALLHLAARETEGVIHVAGPDLVTRLEWAESIATHYGLNRELIDVVTTAELAQPAQRPLRSGLRTNRRAELEGVRLRGVREGLDVAGIR